MEIKKEADVQQTNAELGAQPLPKATLEFSGDEILAQIRAAQSQSGSAPALTPRRPDVRAIVLNASEAEIQFSNPGKHSDALEKIPVGEAFMVMPKGDTLEQQYANAQVIFEEFGLGSKGATPEFIAAILSGQLNHLLAEAYGPAPYAKQVSQLKPVDWASEDGTSANIEPTVGEKASFGARPPSKEEVYVIKLAEDVVKATLQGTRTVAENFEGDIICLGVSEDWKSKEVSTKPIAPSVAKSYYGQNFAEIPVVVVNASGNVEL